MGYNYSKLNEMSDACKVVQTIDSIEGFESKSSSLTDIWKVTFKDNIVYNNKKIDNAIIKWYIDPESFKKSRNILLFDNNTFLNILTSLQSLDYERRVYRDIIRPVLDASICPHFVKYLASGKQCKSTDLLNTLYTNIITVNNPRVFDENIAYKKLLTNFLYTLYTNRNYRPSATATFGGDSVIDRDGYVVDNNTLLNEIFTRNINEPLEHFKYNMLVTEYIPRSITFADLYRDKSLYYDELKTIFQVAVGCYVMSLSRLVHNDLHWNNVMLKSLNNPVLFTYKIDDQYIQFPHDKIALIYDFDRAYAIILGNNPTLDGYLCDRYSQCNKFIANKDIIKFIAYKYVNSTENIRLIDNKLLHTRDTFIRNNLEINRKNFIKTQEVLLDIIAPVTKQYIAKTILTNLYLLDPSRGNSPADDAMFFYNFYDVKTILFNIIKLCPDALFGRPTSNPDPEYTYVIDSKIFRSDGKLIR